MRLKKAWVVARKDLSEFRANKQILIVLAIFPIMLSVIPIITVVPMVTFLTVEPSVEPDLNLHFDIYYHQHELYDSPLINAWINYSTIYNSIVNGSYINNSTLSDVVVRSSLLDNVTIANSVVIGCVLRNSDYDDSSTLLLNTYRSGTTQSMEEEFEFLYDYIIHSMLIFIFFAMAVAMPTTIASYSFVGEKTNKTLEPLLSTPITDAELLWGKYLAIFVPVMSLILISFTIFGIVVDVMTYPTLGYLLIPDLTWIISIFIITPLVCLMSIALNVLISSKVSDVRTAQQYSALIIVPIIMVFVLGPVLGFAAMGLDVLTLIALVLLASVTFLVWLSLKVFNREDILTSWK